MDCPQAAAEHYRALIQLDPADTHTYGGLGLALVAARKYKEAIGPLERALPVAMKERSPIVDNLALAYVAIDDDVNAVRVLRMRFPEPVVREQLARLRAGATGSPR